MNSYRRGGSYDSQQRPCTKLSFFEICFVTARHYLSCYIQIRREDAGVASQPWDNRHGLTSLIHYKRINLQLAILRRNSLSKRLAQ